MIEIDLETRIWGILCSLPALFMLIASIAQFLTTIDIDRNVIVHMLFVLLLYLHLLCMACFLALWGTFAVKKRKSGFLSVC